MGAPQVVAYPSEGVGEPLPMEPDPEAEEDNEDSGISLSLPFSILPVLSSASFSTKFYGWQRGDPQCHPLGGPRELRFCFGLLQPEPNLASPSRASH